MLEEGKRLTPMKTVTDGVDIFLDPKNKITGHIIENCAERCVFRAVSQYVLALPRHLTQPRARADPAFVRRYMDDKAVSC